MKIYDVFMCCFMKYLLLYTGNITKEAGPVSMTFTIPMYNASRLQVSHYWLPLQQYFLFIKFITQTTATNWWKVR